MIPYLGELSALSAAILWSTSSFIFTEATIRIGTIQLNISRMIVASLLLLLTLYIFSIPFEITNYQLLWLSASGFVGLVIGDTFLFKAFQIIGPRLTMLLMSLNPAIAAILAYFILDERLGLFSILGILTTLVGISIVILDKNNNNTKFKITFYGLLAGLLAAFGQGLGLVLAKLAYNDKEVHTLIATFIRITAAIIIMLPISVALKKYKNPFKLFYNDKKSLLLVFIGSIIGPYLGITLSFLAVIHTKVGIASTLMSTMPLIMLPLSKIIYKEKLSGKAIFGAFIAVLGVAILFLV